MRKIRADNAGLTGAAEIEREIARAAAEIENDGAGALEDGEKEARRSPAPEAIDLEGEKMIEEVVARSDLAEHFADFARGVGFGVGAIGAGAWGGGFYVRAVISHGGWLDG
jgi:hypothetical protein